MLVTVQALWPGAGDEAFERMRCCVWKRDMGELGGFAFFALRRWTDGCQRRPGPYIDDW